MEALLGCHTFTNSDQTGRFSVKSETFSWKEFYKSDTDTLEALGKLVMVLFPCLEGKVLWRSVKLLKFL